LAGARVPRRHLIDPSFESLQHLDEAQIQPCVEPIGLDLDRADANEAIGVAAIDVLLEQQGRCVSPQPHEMAEATNIGWVDVANQHAVDAVVS
jgi:hypothetical protein